MNFQTLIEQLLNSGMSERQIAEAASLYLPKPITQSAINRIKRGRVVSPSYALGKALIDLREAKVGAHRNTDSNHTDSPFAG